MLTTGVSCALGAAVYQLYYGENKFLFNKMMMKVALYKTTPYLDFYSANSLKQQSAFGHIAPLGTRYPDRFQAKQFLVVASQCHVLTGIAANTNFIVFGLTLSRFEPMIYCIRGRHANDYTTDAVSCYVLFIQLFFLFQCY